MPPTPGGIPRLALPPQEGANPSLRSSRTSLHLRGSESPRPSYSSRHPPKHPAPVGRALAGGGVRPGHLTRSAAPVARLGDPPCPAPAPGTRDKARPRRPGRRVDRVPPAAASTPSHRHYQPKPLVTPHLASAARAAAAGSAPPRRPVRGGS